jgi:hypothetical protein
MGTSGTLIHTTPVTLVVSPISGGALTGAVNTPTGVQTLSTIGTSDWAHWGLTSATTFVHKAAITPLISNVTLIGGGTATRYTNNPIGFSWTGGTPTASATNSTTGIYVAGATRGFQITVPADTVTRTLTLFVGVWQSQGQLIARLSDQSAPDYVNNSLVNTTTTSLGRYTLVYRAGTAGQTLTVSFIQQSSTLGNVTLQAAALAITTPDFGVAVTPAARVVAPGGSATYDVSVAPTNGFSGDVTLSATGLPTGVTAAFSPATIPGGSGTSTLTVTAAAGTAPGSTPFTVAGVSGGLTRSATPTVTVSVTGAGALTGSLVTPTATQNLATLGTSDWAHWGLTSSTSYNHRAGVTAQISNITPIGAALERYTNHAFGFTWTGGTPTASATNTRTGVLVRGLDNGFQITVPADTTSRTLTVYVGVQRTQGRLTARLSDQSAADYVDSTLVDANGTANGRYTIVYRAAVPGQLLTVTFRQATTATTGNVRMQGATLALTPASP